MDIDILLQKLGKPAQRAVENEGIITLEQLARCSEKEFSKLHGIVKNAINIAKETLKDNGLDFSKK